MQSATVTAEQVRLLSGMSGLTIADEHMPGVVRNLGILLDQAALLFDPPVDPLVEPAAVFRP